RVFALARYLGDGAPLVAASSAEATGARALTLQEVDPLLAEAVARWQAGGVDILALGNIEIQIADLGGATLGLASGNTITLDDNAAGWGWFVDPTPGERFRVQHASAPRLRSYCR